LLNGIRREYNIMRRYSLFQAPVMAFFSLGFYRDVDQHWKGTGFAYLLMLLAICWVPAFIHFHLSVADYVEHRAPALTSQIPLIRIMKGEASVDAAQPYKIVDPDSKTVLALIDTTGKTVSLEGTDAQALLTRTEVIFRKSDVETRSFNFKDVESFTLDQQRVSGWLTTFRRYAAVIFFPFAVLGSFAYRVVQVLIYAAIGLLFAKWCRTDRPYPTLVRLSVMAVTPVIVVSTVIETAGLRIPLPGLLYFVAAMVYLFLGIKAVSRQEPAEVTGR
jgi:Protein of unknown function (DUF1189)